MPDDAETIARLEAIFRNKRCFGPVTDDRGDDAERELAIRFPRSYRLFLRRFGAAWMTAPFEIAGLPDSRATDPEPPRWSNVIDETMQSRQASRGHLPQSYVRISSDGADYSFYLDCAAIDEAGECPVVVLGPGLDGVAVASSFVDWVEMVEAGDPFLTES